MTALAPTSYALATLAVAIFFGGIFLFGSRVCHPAWTGHRRFLSFAAGISVSYVFVHVIPGLARAREVQTQSAAGFPIVFPEYSVYLWAMAGFLGFYGLDTMVSTKRSGLPQSAGHSEAEPWQAWLHIGGFAAYAWLLTYLMMWTGKGSLSLCLYAVAMGMHLFPITWKLSHEYSPLYDRRGAFVQALASLAGWACGLMPSVPPALLAVLVAVVAGGVIVNTMIAELPKEKGGRYPAFLAGAVIYASVLLVVSHFEKGG
jgi:hypothetical protein